MGWLQTSTAPSVSLRLESLSLQVVCWFFCLQMQLDAGIFDDLGMLTQAMGHAAKTNSSSAFLAINALAAFLATNSNSQNGVDAIHFDNACVTSALQPLYHSLTLGPCRVMWDHSRHIVQCVCGCPRFCRPHAQPAESARAPRAGHFRHLGWLHLHSWAVCIPA